MMPVFYRKVLPVVHDDIAALVVVSPIYRGSSWLKQARRFVRAFGVREFLIEISWYGYWKVRDLWARAWGRGSAYSIKGLAKRYGLPLLQPDDINDPEFRATLRGLEPDLIVSVTCPQIFRADLLRLPPMGCVNVHSSLLPDYRGMLPTFWAMAGGERETGVTVHYMSEGVDEGGILAQKKVAITTEDTLHSLMRKCKEAAADAVVETIGRLKDRAVVALPNRVEDGAYFSFPSREDVARFRALGRRLR